MDHSNKIPFLMQCIEEAKKSQISNKHGCIIYDQRFNIISRGHNRYKYHRLCDTLKDHRKGCTIHAEIDAINNCRDKSKLRGAIMFIVRLNKINNNAMYSAPCQNCRKILLKTMQKYGLAKVFFSTDIMLF